jgi:uncharacterized protein (TIRG00374 family)
VTTLSRPEPIPARTRWLQLAAVLVVTAIVVLSLRNVAWGQALAVLASAKTGWLVAAVVANGAVLLFWSGFWRALLPTAAQVSFGRMFEIIAMTSAAMNTMPFLGGHAAGYALLVKRGGVPHHAAISVMALDQLGEGLTKMLIFLVVAVIAPVPVWMRGGVVTVVAGVAALFVVMMTVAHLGTRHSALGTRQERAERRAPSAEYLRRVIESLETLRSPRRAALALCCVVGSKLIEAVAILAVQRSLGILMSPGAAMLVLAATLLATMLPLSPGNLGTYEAGVVLAYRHLGIGAEQALALALLQHLCFLLPAVGVGYAVAVRRSATASR